MLSSIVVNRPAPPQNVAGPSSLHRLLCVLVGLQSSKQRTNSVNLIQCFVARQCTATLHDSSSCTCPNRATLPACQGPPPPPRCTVLTTDASRIAGQTMPHAWIPTDTGPAARSNSRRWVWTSRTGRSRGCAERYPPVLLQCSRSTLRHLFTVCTTARRDLLLCTRRLLRFCSCSVERQRLRSGPVQLASRYSSCCRARIRCSR